MDPERITGKTFPVVQSLAHTKGRLPSMNEKLSAEELFSMAKGDFSNIENAKIRLFLGNSKLYKKYFQYLLSGKAA